MVPRVRRGLFPVGRVGAVGGRGPRFREDSSLLEPFDSEGYLLRAPRREGETLLWEGASTGIPPLDAPPIEVEMGVSKIEALGQLPRRGVRLEVDFFMFPAPVRDEGDRPYFPHMLLTVDAVSGMILGSELLKPFPSQEAMWGSVPEDLADQLSGVGLLPEKVSVDSELLFQLLEPAGRGSWLRARTVPVPAWPGHG